MCLFEDVYVENFIPFSVVNKLNSFLSVFYIVHRQEMDLIKHKLTINKLLLVAASLVDAVFSLHLDLCKKITDNK